MRRRSWSSALFALLILGAAACSRGDAAGPAPAPPSAPQPMAANGALPRLVFFMNPNGGPCQLQDQILREMAGSLAGRVEVVYYRTTAPADLARFEQYGIRSLPQLLLADASGRELRRAPPGIQGPPQVLQLLAP
ncbi:MAG TPA: hypothetical protein VML50_08520 [Anaeromyxobacter sp.]|nr:hypothetical protein [Anaeromyxobacter sp.]